MKRVRSARILRLFVSIAAIALVTVVAQATHARSFVAGFLYLFPLMLIAFRWGFTEACVASVFAVGCLDYFFTRPFLHFYMEDPQDCIALACFEATFLVTSRLADRLRRYAAEADEHRKKTEMLYLMSREILFLDRQEEIGGSLARLIAEVFELASVSLWDERKAQISRVGNDPMPEQEVRAATSHGRRECDLERGRFVRALFIGTRTVGSIGLTGYPGNCTLDPATFDAIASLTAIALERSHSFLAESNAEAARQSEKLRSTVLDGLAHAFKTPLATIQTASSGLLEMEGMERAHEELACLINQEAVRLGSLTTQALQTAKIDRSQLQPKKEQIELDSFLHSLHAQCLVDGVEHDLLIDADTIGNCAWADGNLLRMALLQLIDNAVKYGSPSAPIRIQCSRTESEVVFCVQNEGSYIQPEERPKIFRRFYRSPGSEFRAPGTGIGLSIVRQTAELHNGRVWVESEAAAGTSFFLTLPQRFGETDWKSHKE
jgi:two-component system, OmpR family, sensor histidine kinase KdpD